MIRKTYSITEYLFFIFIFLTLLFVKDTWANHIPFQVGDVFVSVSNGQVQHRNTAGNLLETLNTQQGGYTTGMVFDRLGNLYVTNFDRGNVRKFNNTGGLIGTFGSGYSGNPESILFDRNGNAYVGSVDGDNDIRKFDAQGNLLAQYNVITERRGSDWIDLAADQCTLFYTSEGANVKRFDVCQNLQLSNFNTTSLPTPIAYALRVLPSGGLLVADTSQIVRLDPSGNLIQSYDAPGQNCWFALNLDPDGQSFWSADFCSSSVYKFDIATGNQLLSFNTGTGGSTVFGLVVYGEITVAQPDDLRARVGNTHVYLQWDPPSEPVDSYDITIERFSTGEIAHAIVNIAERADECDSVPSCYTYTDSEVTNGQLYRYTISAIKNGVKSPPSSPVLARPSEFGTGQIPEKPRFPIIFFHGICLSELYPVNASSWDITRDFFSNSLHWQFGGMLSYLENDDPRLSGPLVQNYRPDGDFYTITFGNCQADYSYGREGLLHQADEVQGFIRKIYNDGIQDKFSLVAHSMGGVSVRAYIAYNQPEATERVSDYISYSSPHWGAALTDLFPISAGARNLGWDCTDGHIDYSGNPFLDNLRQQTLPEDIRYFAIRGHSHQNFPSTPHRQNTQGCLSTHWDGLMPIDTADFGSVPPSAPEGQVNLTTNDVPVLTTNRTHSQQTNDFPAILCALDPRCFVLTVRSPVNIEVIAPNGLILGNQLTEIPGASYMDLEDDTGHPISTILIPFPTDGDYKIKVMPKPGALPTDIYTIELTINGITTTLAQNQQINNIPSDGYTVSVLAQNSQPTANAGPDQTLACTSPVGTPVTLDGSVSSDPDSDSLSYKWTNSFGETGGINPTVSLPTGKSTITLIVNDGQVDSSPDTVDININYPTGDLDSDCDVDKNDVNKLLTYRNKPASTCPQCDLDGDGKITALDSRKLTLLCTRPGCATQ